jgi:hypothetical protein
MTGARRTSARPAPGTLGLIIKSWPAELQIQWVDAAGKIVGHANIPDRQFFTWVAVAAPGDPITTITIDLTGDVLNDPADVAADQEGNQE